MAKSSIIERRYQLRRPQLTNFCKSITFRSPKHLLMFQSQRFIQKLDEWNRTIKKLHGHSLSLSCTPTSHLLPLLLVSQYRAKHKIDNFYHHGAVTYRAIVMNSIQRLSRWISTLVGSKSSRNFRAHVTQCRQRWTPCCICRLFTGLLRAFVCLFISMED